MPLIEDLENYEKSNETKAMRPVYVFLGLLLFLMIFSNAIKSDSEDTDQNEFVSAITRHANLVYPVMTEIYVDCRKEAQNALAGKNPLKATHTLACLNQVKLYAEIKNEKERAIAFSRLVLALEEKYKFPRITGSEWDLALSKEK